MAPKAAELEAALADATRDIFRNSENVTINAVRKQAEKQLNLEEGFFKSGDWKTKSKDIIKALVDELVEKDEQEEPKPATALPVLKKVDKNRKHSVDETAGRQSKRRKSEPAPVKKVENVKTEAAPKSPPAAAPAEVHDDSDGSSTSVLADTPPPKRKSKAKHEKHEKAKHEKPAKQAKHAATHKAAPSSPDEEEIKKLQGQLVKCGVRKIWGIELKGYGDDAKAKIRHLKSMLRDIGMEGRFSESRAREIKERRELMADLEGVQEMDNLWGVNGSGRTSRSRAAKNLKEASDTDSDKDGEDDAGGDEKHDKDEDEDEEDDMPKTKAQGRRSARQADLAFLGSESESDSD